MAKRRKDRRKRYVELIDGRIIDWDTAKHGRVKFVGEKAKKANTDYVERVFLADTKYSVLARNGAHSYTSTDFFNVENLVSVDGGNYVRQRSSHIARTVTTLDGTTLSINGMSTGVFQTDLPDLQSFIKELNLLDENVNKAVVIGLKRGADIIVAAQKRRISAKSQRLANAITKGSIYTTKKGAIGIATGYLSNAFYTTEDGFNAGIVGMVFEFGRPGQKGDTMKQKRNGETVTVKIGAIQPVPHIRAGFDEAVNSASQTVIDTVSAEIDKLGE